MDRDGALIGVTSELASIYEAAVVRVWTPAGLVTLDRDGARGEASWVPAAGEAIFVITAHNPGDERLGTEGNAVNHARLVADIDARHLTAWRATGGAEDLEGHQEESLAVHGLSESDAIELGRAYGQDAIFEWTAAGRRLIWCDDARRKL